MRPLFLLSSMLIAGFVHANDCQPSRWGVGDELGNANLITPESVLAASRLVTEGRTYPLGIVIDSSTPAYPPRQMSLQIVQPGQQFGQMGLPNSTYNDDIFIGWLGIGSQLDGLGHIGGPDGMFYNCHHGRDFAQITGLTRLGTHAVPPIVARGIVLDMAAHRGVDYLAAGEVIGLEELKAVARKQGTPVRDGVYEFLFVLGQARVRGAVQMIINPVAIR
jgi:hypothetical protein